MRAKHIRCILLFTAFGIPGCGDTATSGADEPFRVYRVDDGRAAQFFPGRLPVGRSDQPATSAPEDTNEPVASADGQLPEVTSFDPTNRIIFPGQKNGAMKGLLSVNSASVALEFDAGSGFWVMPAGTPDVGSDGKLEWKAKVDFSPNIEPGYHDITAAAIGPDGRFGTSITHKICIAGRTADYINACESKVPPPETVISLSWDTNVDLDLQIVTPKGRLVTPKFPTTVEPNEDGALPEGAGMIDRDSNAACDIDGIRFENLVFDKEKPTRGSTWGIYVDLFDACKQAVVHFDVGVYVAKQGKDGNKRLVQIGNRQGMLLASQVNGGQTEIGTYLFEVTF